MNYLYMVLCACLAACASLPSSHPDADFIGSWKLIKWTSELADGTIVYPYGQAAYGKLIYEPSGDMTGILMSDDRPLMSSADVSSRLPDEALDAFNSFFAYAGPFEVNRDSGFVLHHVEACINPNWVGLIQKRYYRFEEGRLILSTPPIAVQGTNNEAVSQVLVWEKSE